MKQIRYLGFFIVLSAVYWGGPALAEKRLALLVANQDYAAAVGPLKNPFNDITRISNALSLGSKSQSCATPVRSRFYKR